MLNKSSSSGTSVMRSSVMTPRSPFSLSRTRRGRVSSRKFIRNHRPRNGRAQNVHTGCACPHRVVWYVQKRSRSLGSPGQYLKTFTIKKTIEKDNLSSRKMIINAKHVLSNELLLRSQIFEHAYETCESTLKKDSPICSTISQALVHSSTNVTTNAPFPVSPKISWATISKV